MHRDVKLEALGHGVAARLRERGFDLEQVLEISTLHSTRLPIRAYLLGLVGGGRLKLRRFGDEQRARVVASLMARARAAGLGIARVIDSFDDVLVIEWVDAPALGAPTGTNLHMCGMWLAKLHGLDVGGVAREPKFAATPHQALATLAQHCALLTEAATMTDNMAKHVLARARAGVPEHASLGLAHCDFCGENLVLGDAGMPASIDNANMHVGLLELDLARTFARWPLDPTQRRVWLDGYRQRRSPDAFCAHFEFWMACSLTTSAATRVRMAVEGAPALVARL
jgi:Phosphotransferase enzyme family